MALAFLKKRKKMNRRWMVLASLSELFYLICHSFILGLSFRFPCDTPLPIGVLCYILFYAAFILPELPIRILSSSPSPWLLTVFQCSRTSLVFWFVIGNLSVWPSQTCSRTNPLIYWAVFSNVILGYLLVAAPLISVLIMPFLYHGRLMHLQTDPFKDFVGLSNE
jgi:hypothetical protein